MVQFVYVKTSNRKEIFYWKCDTRQCGAMAGTERQCQEHVFRYAREHNHAPDPARAPLAEMREAMKRKAASTNDAPAAIISNSLSSQPEAAVYSANRDALRQMIKRVRREELPPEPTELSQIDIPNELRTVNGQPFLIGNFDMDNEEKIIIFGTKENMRLLQEALYWIIDGTFKSCPSLFHQMFSIHAPVGTQPGTIRIVPLVYVFMSKRTEEFYLKVFEEVADFAAEHDYELAPQYIIQDFEQAPISAASRVFPSVKSIGCHFHFCQSVWRKIQGKGLAAQYGGDLTFALNLRHLTALAFLSADEIPDAFEEVKKMLQADHPEANPIVEYFEQTYVLGKKRPKGGRTSPLYPPSFWSVSECYEFGLPRTQNHIEAWHRRWNSLVGSSTRTYVVFKHVIQEQEQTEIRVEKVKAGQPRTPLKSKPQKAEVALKNVLEAKEFTSTLDFLRGVAYNSHMTCTL